MESFWKSYRRIQRVREPYCRGLKLPSGKCGILYFLPKERSRILCIVFCFLFCSSKGWSYRKNSPKRSGEASFKIKLKFIVPFLSNQKIVGRLTPLPCPFFKGKFTRGDLPLFLYEIRFIVLISLWRLNFTCGNFRGICLGGDFQRYLNFLGDFCVTFHRKIYH